MKFARKCRWHYPSHPRHVATLPWEIKTSNFLQILKKSKQIAFLIASTFVIHPQILIFSVFKITTLPAPYWLQIKFSLSLFFYLFTLAKNLWRRKFVTEDSSLQCLSTINMILSDEDKILIKKVCIWKGTQQRGWQTNFQRKAGQSVMLISCSKSCGSQAQLTGCQAVADRAVTALKKTLSFFFRNSRSLPLTCSADCQVKWPRTPFCP